MRRGLYAAGLLVLVAACGGIRLSDPPVGTYSNQGAEATAIGRDITLNLNRDGSANLRETFKAKKPFPIRWGRWKKDGDDIRVTLSNPGEIFVWHLDGDRLVPVEWSRSIWGAAGVRLTLEQ